MYAVPPTFVSGSTPLPTMLREAFLRRTCRRAEQLAGLHFFESDVRFHVIPSRRLNTLTLY